MYLEQPRTFGATQVVSGTTLAGSRVQCADGSYDVSNGFAAPCLSKGGVKGGVKPSIPPKPKFKAGYILKGTPPSNNWVYPNCNAGYVKQMVNKPHPEMYSCFDPAELAWNKKYGIMF